MTKTYLAAAALLCALTASASAESTAVQLTGTWQKIAPAGTNVELQAIAGQVFVTTADCYPATCQGPPSPPSASSIGLHLAPEEHRCMNATWGDLYAKAAPSGTLIVTDGITCGR